MCGISVHTHIVLYLNQVKSFTYYLFTIRTFKVPNSIHIVIMTVNPNFYGWLAEFSLSLSPSLPICVCLCMCFCVCACAYVCMCVLSSSTSSIHHWRTHGSVTFGFYYEEWSKKYSFVEFLRKLVSFTRLKYSEESPHCLQSCMP